MFSLRTIVFASVAAVLCLTVLPARGEEKIADQYRTNGYAIGCQAWCFWKFSLMEAIAKTHEAGGKVIELYPGQKLSPEQPTVEFDHNSPEAVVRQVQAQLRKYDILPVSYGVVMVRGKSLEERKPEWKKVFTFAKALGMRAVCAEPKAEDMDYIESLVKENDVCLAIHDHPRVGYDPDYQFWDPHYVLSLVKGRDKRIGSCADTGHWARSGIKPIEALKILEGRIISSHLKDLNVFDDSDCAHDVPYGTGVCDVKGILDELKRQGFTGQVLVEYEYHEDNSVPEIKQCIEFVKHYGAAKD